MQRREFLALVPSAIAAAQPGKKKVGAIVTEYRYRSHADVIVGRILEGYSPNGVRTEPRTRIVSMYTDQIAPKDMSRDLAAKHGFKIYPTIAQALTLGGDNLAVDAVLLVGEHGDYPRNDKGQKMYPRYELFEQIVTVFRKSGRSVPVFSDKHLSYSWTKAKKMYDWSRELGFPFMAGSSIPVTVRRSSPDPTVPTTMPMAFIPSRRFSVWSSAARAVKLESRPSRCSPEMPSGAGATARANGAFRCLPPPLRHLPKFDRVAWKTMPNSPRCSCSTMWTD